MSRKRGQKFPCDYFAQQEQREGGWRRLMKVRPTTRTASHATHIAGYVPPKGWTAWAFCGRLVRYH